MLNASIQKTVRQSYQNLQASLEQFTPRRAQNYLVAEIVKTLSGQYHAKNKILVAEAGTGIGKSLAYLMATIPFSQLTQQKVIISTATVALQEQLIHKDLPLYRRLNPQEFEFRLVKGRQRYCCLEKLALACQMDETQIALFTEKPKESDNEDLKCLYEAYSSNKWDGDRDNWPKPIPDRIWQAIVSDKHTCNNTTNTHRNCPFQKARNELDKANVLVVNHSIVLSDLELGGGVILPEPEQCIYVFDEAHHLPHIARDHASASASLKGSSLWLESLNKSASKYANIADLKQSGRFLTQLQKSIQELIPTLNEVYTLCQSFPLEEAHYRFEHGELPNTLFELAKSLKDITKKGEQALFKIMDLINERIKEAQVSTKIAEPLLAEAGIYAQRFENLAKVWSLMAQKNRDKGAPLARWIEKNPERERDFILNVSPLEIGWLLDQKLWSRCAGAILVSATMRALNSFYYFNKEAGIPTLPELNTQFLALASPFDYQNKGLLHIPMMEKEPSAPEFTEYLSRVIPTYIQENKANLILFSSYWQMNQVADFLEKIATKNKWNILVQGQSSRAEILKKHRATCQFQKTSILLGTGSFSEGLDLPGHLLENLIITKIPFGVPSSPIEQAHAEFIEAKGGNPFMQIAIPKASKKLIQAAGRLLRKEEDQGRIVILDRRIVTKRYGSALLDALPPFKRQIDHI